MAISRFEEIKENLIDVQSRIDAAILLAGRQLGEVNLIAVTKTFPISDVQILQSLGLSNFGENRDADGAAKAAALEGKWHFQGQIQSNKLKSITRWASVIHSLDDPKHFTIIEEIAPHPLEIFCQYSLDGAAGRGGMHGQEFLDLAEMVQQSPRHTLMGIMTVAPLGMHPDHAFEQVAQFQQGFLKHFPGATQLSAGMSGDYESAIAHGATHVRVGSSILGSRGANR